MTRTEPAVQMVSAPGAYKLSALDPLEEPVGVLPPAVPVVVVVGTVTFPRTKVPAPSL